MAEPFEIIVPLLQEEGQPADLTFSHQQLQIGVAIKGPGEDEVEQRIGGIVRLGVGGVLEALHAALLAGLDVGMAGEDMADDGLLGLGAGGPEGLVML